MPQAKKASAKAFLARLMELTESRNRYIAITRRSYYWEVTVFIGGETHAHFSGETLEEALKEAHRFCFPNE